MRRLAHGRAVPPCVVALAALAASGGCVPPGDFRPAAPFVDGRTSEIGAGVVASTKRPYVDEPTRAVGQLWGAHRFGERISVAGVGAFDDRAVALGAAFRVDALRFDRFALAGEVQLGYAWAGLSMPMAVRLFDATWLYAGPRALPRFQEWMLDLPVGLSVRVHEGFALRAEAHATWVDLDPYSRRFHLGLAAAYQF